jgi:hypothetical protein
LANLPAWIQLASLASFSPPGLGTLDALVDSTTHYETHTSRHFSIFSQILLPLAQNHEQWKTLGTEWIKHWQALTIYQYGPHPLLGDGILDHQFFWYLQDIHCQLSMNDGHVWSIFLCSFYYVMIFLLFWGHEPCIRFFLWQFNMPDALICYPGSIEKLKLLGATYLLLNMSSQ